MRPIPALLLLTLAASCVPAPRPAPLPPRRVLPPPPASPIARPTDWRDWPQTPGDWTYRPVPGGSIARFGSGQTGGFSLQCVRATGTVLLTAYVPTGGAATVRTSSLTRTISFGVDGDPPGGSVTAALAPRDPLLDAMGFSRGRFVVELPGAEPLVLPAWAEVERVVEDCRG